MKTSAECPFGKSIQAQLPALRRRALHLTRRPQEAEDLVQDTVVRALRFQNSFSAGTNLRAWLCQILFSVFITQVRRRGRERRALCSFANDPNLAPTSFSAPVLEHLPIRVEGAMKELPSSFEHVVRLVDLDEFSYQEAAEVLEIPVGTVMSRLHRGRKLLAGKLAETEILAAA
ncbi:MAG: RNA polymerase sigma factor [Polyangiaceae bacterium]|nr:RNA polymerase sigma factor [Polyangiaceae bacterium]